MALSVTVASRAWSATWSDTFTIGDISFEGGGGKFYVHPTTALPNNSTNNPMGCANGGNTYIIYLANTSAAEQDTIYRTLLSAFLAGKQVSLNVSGLACSQGGTNGSAVFGGVRVFN